MDREDLLTRTLVELADSLVTDLDVVELLSFLTRRLVELIDTADGAGIMLANRAGELQYMASSNESSELLELFELQHDEGPCRDCFKTGRSVLEPDLALVADRWPTFVPYAIETGFRSALALPMRIRDQVIGSLNVFGVHPGALPDADVRLAQALADVATISIVQTRAIGDAQRLSDQLSGALSSRVLIEQAKGMLAERCAIDLDEAFNRLRRYARSGNLRLSGVAEAIVTGTLSAQDLQAATEHA